MTLPSISPEYVPIRHIESGGQADVYEVRHVLGGRFAARVLREAWDPMAREDFRKCIDRQLRAAGPRVVPILAYNVNAHRPFMILEYMPHGSLADAILRRRDKFTLVEALLIAESLAQALADAHEKGFAHGDFKPGNILQNADGVWMLSDFGSAVTVDSHEIFRAPRWVGTPAYAAPEQLRGITMQASDVYALGVVLVELLTGARESAPADLTSIGQRHGAAASGLPEILARLTARDVRLRPSARDAAQLLRNARRAAALFGMSPLGVSPQAPASSFAARVARPSRSDDTPDWLKALVLIGGTVATAAVANRATKSWDPSVGRYRGSDGKFRGSGLFE